MNYPIKQRSQRRWTQGAVECYQKGCRCSTCFIPKICETKCKMKEAVLLLVKKFGKPEDIEEFT